MRRSNFAYKNRKRLRFRLLCCKISLCGKCLQRLAKTYPKRFNFNIQVKKYFFIHIHFSTSLYKLAKTLTVIIALLFSFAIYSSVYLNIAERKVLLLITAVFLVIVFVVVYSFKPIRSTITNDKLIIRRLFENVEFSKSEI